MAGEPVITVVGNLTDDPDLRFTPSGAAVANFTVAQTPRTKQGDEWVDGEALFMRCSAWRTLAENVAESLRKGHRVIVQGRLRANSWEDRDGNKRTSYQLEVDAIGPELSWATASVTRASRNTAAPARQQRSRESWGESAGSAWDSGHDSEPPF